ncbi:MAG: hypothetical protein AMJ95_09525 [Omnitrophica WOR_2 bacterium SM23_72]|nr:MAG: hypothetical protein AMJ95_09525 [Omnitrophica WOR_2 bacterium SM23_72]
MIFGVLSGCSQPKDLKEVQGLAQQAQQYYQEAVDAYKALIKKGDSQDRLHFELGHLYYSHGELERAVEEFKNSKEPEAKKYLAISYYRLSLFTDALEIFNKHEIEDAEYLFYKGLTCEKLNLYEKALDIYKKINVNPYRAKAKERIQTIERQESLESIERIDPSVYKILSRAPSADTYPQAGAMVLFSDEKVEVTADGKEVTSLHYIIKILNERGKADFSETHIDYDSTFEKVELEYARTIKPDGKVLEVGSRHIRDVSKYLNFPLYSNVHVTIISFPEVTEGCAIEYKLKIYNNRLINKKDLVLAYTLQSKEPILEASFVMHIPKDNPLHIKILNDRYNDFGSQMAPEIKEEEGFLSYRWQFKDIPQIIPEADMPPACEINPVILMSTFDNWQEIYEWWWELAQDKIKADRAIKREVKELIQDKPSDEEKIRAIYNFCAQKIRYVAVEYGEAGYEPHASSDIFKNKYGDCKDQSILLVTMLREAGFSAWPVLIATKDYYNLNEDFPSVLFNHCIAAVSLQDKVYFLDPTAQTCPFMDLPVDDQGRKILLFKEDSYEIKETVLFPATHNLVRQVISLKVDSDETIAAKKEIFTFGFYDQGQRYWLLYTQPEIVQEVLKAKIQNISIGAVLNQYTIENLDDLNKPIVLKYDFWGPEFFTVAGNLRLLPQLGSVDTSIVAKEKRRYPIDFGFLESSETVNVIEIPDNFAIKYIPEEVTEDSPWLKIFVEYVRQDQRIEVRQRMEAKKDKVAQEEYLDFKRFVEDVAKKTKQRIVLEKKN